MKKNNPNQQYIPAVLLILFSAYQLTKPDYWEFAMYFMAGVAFLLMGLIRDGWMKQYRRLLDIISWTLIILTGLLFLYMVSTDG